MLAVVLLDEADGAVHRRESGGFVPLVLHRFAVAGEPAAGAVAGSHVEPHPHLARFLDRPFRFRADLHHRRRAGAEQLGHRVGETGAGGLLISSGAAGRQELEQPGEVELTRSPILDERFVERRFVEMGVGVDEAGGDDLARAINRFIDLAVKRFADMDDLVVFPDDDAIPQMTMPTILVRNDVRCL